MAAGGGHYASNYKLGAVIVSKFLHHYIFREGLCSQTILRLFTYNIHRVRNIGKEGVLTKSAAVLYCHVHCAGTITVLQLFIIIFWQGVGWLRLRPTTTKRPLFAACINLKLIKTFRYQLIVQYIGT